MLTANSACAGSCFAKHMVSTGTMSVTTLHAIFWPLTLVLGFLCALSTSDSSIFRIRIQHVIFLGVPIRLHFMVAVTGMVIVFSSNKFLR